jgi:transketolase
MLFASNPYEHFVQKVGIAEARVSAAKTFGKPSAEFVDPESYRFVADGDIAFG